MEKKVDFHGGNIYKIRREKGTENIIDYSSNINPYGLSEKLKETICNNLDVLERYPDPEYVELREKIAEVNGLEIGNIIAGNGASEIIFLYMKVLKSKRILIISPTFSEYERGIRGTLENVEIDYFRLREEDDFIPNIKELERELEKKYDLLIMCNPNNPTGKFMKLEIMEEILEKCNEFGTKFFVDEAFVEFVENWERETIAKSTKDKKNLFILRAFTKFFAIPGLRLGYGICFDDEFFGEMNRKKEPWSINNIADLTGQVVLEDREYIEKTNNWIREEKHFMYEKLGEIEGLNPYKTEINFILVKIEEAQVEKGLNVGKLREEMLERGILIRDASNFVYLDESYFRLAIKDRKNNERLLIELREIMGKYK